MPNVLRLQMQDDETGADAPNSSFSFYNCTRTEASAEVGG